MKKLIFLSVLFGLISIGCRKDPELIPVEENSPDTLSIPKVPNFGTYIIPENNPTTKFGVELGRMLFYEKLLSSDNRVSCASCHRQEFGFTDGEAVSKGVGGQFGDRSSMALANLLWDKHFFWDGRAASLEEQALMPIENPIEMNETLENVVKKLEATEIYPAMFKKAFGDESITSERIGFAIAQFERTMISSNSKFDKFLRGEYQMTEQELKGYNLFGTHPDPGVVRGGNCGDCHLGYNFTNKELVNNGVDKVVGEDMGLAEITGLDRDKGKFKVPSLRNIAVTAPYMHDGRFKTLEEVLNHYNDTTLFSHENIHYEIYTGTNEYDGTFLALTEDEEKAIIAFLKLLTDEQFLTDTSLSNPF